MIGLLAALAWADPPTPGEELAPDVQGLAMRARPIADGIVRTGRWTAVDATVVNVGPDASGSLSTSEQIDVDLHTLAFSRDVELAKGSRKRVLVPITPGMGPDHVLSLDLGGRGLDRRYSLRVAADTDVTVGVIGDDALGIQALGTTWGGAVPGPVPRATSDTRTVQVGLLDPAALPDRSLLYASFDWVVWSKPQAGQLAPAEIDALLGWVADGGHLFVTVSDDAAAVAASPLADALPVTLTGVRDQTLGDLGDWVRQPIPPTVTPVASATLRAVPGRDTWTWARTGGQPLLAAWSYGVGTVHVLLADPAVEPLAHSVDRAELWRRLLWLPPEGASADWYQRDVLSLDTFTAGSGFAFVDSWPSSDASTPDHPLDRDLVERLHLGGSGFAAASIAPTYAAPSGFEDTVRASLSQIPGVAPLPTSWLMVFSVLYLLIIGPFDWFVLKALRREPWTWVTYPLYILVFSGLALVATSIHKGSQAASVRIELVDALPGAPYWRGDDYFGIFSIQRSQVRLQSGFDGGMVTPLLNAGSMWEPRIEAGDGAGALSWRAETWTLAYVKSRWVARAPGSITVTREGEDWIVHNDTDHSLLDSAVAYGDRTFVIGPVPARGTARANRATAEMVPLDPTTVDLRLSPPPRAILGWATSVFGNRPTLDRGLLDTQWAHPSLIALSSDPIEPVQIDGLSLHEVRVSVLRVPVAPSILEGLPAPQPLPYGAGHVAAGVKVEIVELGVNDYNYANRASYIHKACWVQYDADANVGMYYQGITLLCDGQTYPQSFNEVRIRITAPARATPYLDAGKQVRVIEYGPDETADKKHLGSTCTVEYAYGNASFYSGSMSCAGEVVSFNRAWLEDLSAVVTFLAPWDALALTGDQDAVLTSTDQDLELAYPTDVDASGLFTQHVLRVTGAGWVVRATDAATNSATIERDGVSMRLDVTAGSDVVKVHYTRL